MSNSEDHGTPVDDIELVVDGSEATSQEKEMNLQPRDGSSAKRFRIITEEEEYKCSLP